MKKEDLEKIIRSRMPFAIKNSKGKFKYPFISRLADELVVEALTNGIYEELSKFRQHDTNICACGSDKLYSEQYKDVIKYYCSKCHEKV